MQEQESDLDALIRKYQNTIDSLNIQVKDAKNKLEIARAALYLLKEEGKVNQKKLFEPIPIPVGDKYSNTKLKDAIIDVLKTHNEEKLTGVEIFKELIENGFNSKSANIRRDVYISLNRLRQDRKSNVSRLEEGNRKRYFIAES